MSLPRTLRALRKTTPHIHPQSQARTLTTTPSHLKAPSSNLPDPSPHSSAAPNAKVRTDTQNKDPQSSTSQDEHKSGDDHPAKQPDYQAQPSRSTGIGGQEEVKGGKEGFGDRGKQ